MVYTFSITFFLAGSMMHASYFSFFRVSSLKNISMELIISFELSLIVSISTNKKKEEKKKI